MSRAIIFSLLLLHLAKAGVCQIQPPQAPTFQPVNIPTPQPATMQRYDNTNYFPNPNGQVRMGATAQDIINQTNAGNPYYRAPGDNRTIQQMNNDRIMQELQNDPAYNPRLRNGVSNNYPINKQQELFTLLQDIVDLDNSRIRTRGAVQEDYTAPAFAAKTEAYTSGLQSVQAMLSGKKKLSIADAYYLMESAYGESYMTAAEFHAVIKENADFIKTWMQQNNLKEKNNSDINYAVQQFMSQTLTVALPEKQKVDDGPTLRTVSHQPYFYDYVDFTGEKDHRNYFLTKCLATGSGQCNSMPAVYLVLVEALGGTAYLTVAPNHSFIKYPDKTGRLRNYEPTSNWDISDQWYQENMFISQEAVKNGIYLAPMNKKQIVADVALQMAFGYFRKYGAADEKFIKACIATAQPQFPKNNNLAVYFTYSNLYGYELAQVMRKNNLTRLSDISRSPEAQNLYQKWLDNEKVITQLGYQQEPPDMYDQVMRQSEFKGRIQQQRNIDGKQKRSLFIKSH